MLWAIPQSLRPSCRWQIPFRWSSAPVESSTRCCCSIDSCLCRTTEGGRSRWLCNVLIWDPVGDTSAFPGARLWKLVTLCCCIVLGFFLNLVHFRFAVLCNYLMNLCVALYLESRLSEMELVFFLLLIRIIQCRGENILDISLHLKGTSKVLFPKASENL